MHDVLALAREMVAVDSRSSVSNIPLLEAMQARLAGWQLERIDYNDDVGVPKGNLVARWPGSKSRLAYAGHLDTVSAAGWTTNPFAATIDGGRLVGLGAADMKGPIAAFLCAAASLAPEERPLLVLTADEETTKRASGRWSPGASSFVRQGRPASSCANRPDSAWCGDTVSTCSSS